MNMSETSLLRQSTSFVLSAAVVMFMWAPDLGAKQDGKLKPVKKGVNVPSKVEALQRSNPDVSVDGPAVEKTMKLDIDRINEIRMKKEEALKRIERSQQRSKREQIAKSRRQIESQNSFGMRRIQKSPSVGGLFKAGNGSFEAGMPPVRHFSTPQGVSSDSIYVRVNGVDSDTITQGEDFFITIYFSSGAVEADVEFWIDMNDNGTWEESIDFDVDEGDHIVDNDDEDENPASGVYKFTIHGDEEEGPNRIANLGALLVATDAGGTDDAFLYIEPKSTALSVSGTVTPATANIIVGAFPRPGWDEGDKENPWMALTDASGSYQIFVPDSGHYVIFSEDFLEVTDGWFADTVYFDVYVDGYLTGYDFAYVAPNAWVEGTVADEFGAPLEDVEIWAGREFGPGTWTDTDSNGYFIIGLRNEEWWVGVDEEDLIPDYLVPWDEHVYLAEDDTAEFNFTAYSTDETISGRVFLNNSPKGHIGVGADCVVGWTETESHEDGFYQLSVTSAADDEGGYNLWVWDIPRNVIVEEWYWGIMSGSGGIDFHLKSVLGAIEGIVRDSETSDPLDNGWVNAWDGEKGFGTGTHHDGTYHLPLPNGKYEIDAGADGYYPHHVGRVAIMDNVIVLDIYLDPVTFDGSLSGYVYEPGSSIPVPDAEVDVGSEFYWDHTHSDTSGYYHFDLPNGYYWAGAWKESYTSDWADSIVIGDNDVTHDFLIEPLVIDAAIEGEVTDGESGIPIIGAWVGAESDMYWTETTTGPNGYFLLDVPSDTFWIDVFAEGFHPEFGLEVYVASGDTAWLDVALKPMRVEPPVIHSVVDVPHDQGRRVHITWWSGNPEHFGPWTKFSIWRLAEHGEHPVWDFVAAIPFHGIEDYGFVAPTLIDSNRVTGPTGNYWSTFRVTAHTFDPWTFFDSEPMEGYSVDNLRPRIPAGVVATGGDEPITLSWRPNPDPDMDYYTIYRGSAPGFVPGGEPYAYTIDTLFVDITTEPEVDFYYVVTATDFNGNESEYSDEVSSSTTALSARDEALQIPTRFELAQNYPNPFNPVTTIRYALPERSEVALVVYDALGRQIRTLVHGPQEIGYYHLTWDATDDHGQSVASGVYLIQLIARPDDSRLEFDPTSTGGFMQTRKTILLR